MTMTEESVLWADPEYLAAFQAGLLWAARRAPLSALKKLDKLLTNLDEGQDETRDSYFCQREWGRKSMVTSFYGYLLPDDDGDDADRLPEKDELPAQEEFYAQALGPLAGKAGEDRTLRGLAEGMHEIAMCVKRLLPEED
jgi:hypothetical protein